MQSTVGSTIPWVWVLSCVRVEKMNRAASMRVFIFFSTLAVVATSFFKVPSRVHQDDGLDTSNCELDRTLSPKTVICQSIVIIAIEMKTGQISMSN